MEAYNRFEIVRIRNFFSHDHGQVTKVDMEITILTTDKSEHIVLESDKFLPNLRMADSSGEEYPLMSSKHLRIMLENTAAADSDHSAAARLLADIRGRKKHLLWFRIPPHKALQPNEARVLHLAYEHPKRDAGLLGTIRSLRTGTVVISVPPALPFPVFWILGKPADYNISRRRYSTVKADRTTDMGSWEDNADAVFCKSTAKSESLHVKPCRDGATLSYSLTPKKIVLALPVAAIAMLSLLAISLWASPYLGGGGPLQPLADAIVLYKMPLLLFIIASSLVVPRFVDDAHLRNGLLWLYFVPIGLALCSFVL